MDVEGGQIFCQRQVSEFALQFAAVLADDHQAKSLGTFLVDRHFAQVGEVQTVVGLHDGGDFDVARLHQMVTQFGETKDESNRGLFQGRGDGQARILPPET